MQYHILIDCNSCSRQDVFGRADPPSLWNCGWCSSVNYFLQITCSWHHHLEKIHRISNEDTKELGVKDWYVVPQGDHLIDGCSHQSTLTKMTSFRPSQKRSSTTYWISQDNGRTKSTGSIARTPRMSDPCVSFTRWYVWWNRIVISDGRTHARLL